MPGGSSSSVNNNINVTTTGFLSFSLSLSRCLSHLVTGESTSGGRGVVFLASVVVEDANNHKGVGHREARASLGLLPPPSTRVRPSFVPIIAHNQKLLFFMSVLSCNNRGVMDKGGEMGGGGERGNNTIKTHNSFRGFCLLRNSFAPLLLI